jgi:hypothetical protein
MVRACRAALLLAALPGLAAADDVLLKNGRSFEGVLAERAGDEVRIRMPGGELRIPASHVLRIDAGRAPYAEYLNRRGALRQAAAAAGEWLELARWALAHDLQQSAREAALVAAALDPKLPGLDALLPGFGYTFEETRGRWIPHEEWMLGRGFVHYEGRWMTREEQAERLREYRREAAERAARLEEIREARLRREERLEILELREARREAYLAMPAYAVPIAIFPGFVIPHPFAHGDRDPRRPGGPGGDHRGPRHSAEPPQRIDSYFLRQPGSLVPGDLDLSPPRGDSRGARRGGSSR